MVVKEEKQDDCHANRADHPRIHARGQGHFEDIGLGHIQHRTDCEEAHPPEYECETTVAG